MQVSSIYGTQTQLPFLSFQFFIDGNTICALFYEYNLVLFFHMTDVQKSFLFKALLPASLVLPQFHLYCCRYLLER